MDFLKRVCSVIVPVLLRLFADFLDDFFGGDDHES